MMVVTLNVENNDACYILINNGRLADVLYYDALTKMKISPDRLGRMDSPLVGFTGDAIKVEGVINLPVRIGHYPHRSIALVDFLIIRAPSTFNIILG